MLYPYTVWKYGTFLSILKLPYYAVTKVYGNLGNDELSVVVV